MDHSKTHELAAQIARHLTGWSYDPKASIDTDGGQKWFAVLTADDRSGAALHVQIDHKGRAKVDGCIPYHTKDGKLVYYRDDVRKARTSIGVDALRPPETIAREVERRLLPCYLATYRRALEVVHENEDHTAGMEALAHRIAAAMQTTAREGNGSGWCAYDTFPSGEGYDNPDMRTRVDSPSSVRIELSLPADLAVRVVSMIDQEVRAEYDRAQNLRKVG